jgi:type I restriction enzyme S subunit
MQLLEHFKELTLHPKNAEELKGLILQLAVQGKLTRKWREENPDVEPASVLLEKIRAEKEGQINEKKRKKDKPILETKGNEIPFELPYSWIWTKLSDVCEYIQRGKSPDYTETPKIPVISQKCVQWSGFDISKARFITEESLDKYDEERFLKTGDLLWNSTGDGTLGRVITYPGSEFGIVVADSHVTVVRPQENSIIPDYLWVYTASPFIQKLVAGKVTGSTKQTELSTGTIRSLEFSLPPLAEQKAIIETVNQLFAEVEQLEGLTKERIQLKADFVTSALNQLTQAAEQDTASQWAFLQQHFGTFFTEKANIKKLREAILQLAVQGKLTHHWRTTGRLSGVEVESASILLEKIKAEKAELIKAGKIKKEKPLPRITEEEVPYELPEGWVWCKLGEILKEKPRNGYSPKGVDYVTNTKSLKLGATTRGFFNPKEVKYLNEEIATDSYLWLKPNDILIQRSNSIDYVGVSAIYEGLEGEFVYPDLMMKIQVFEPITPKFLHLILSSKLSRDYFRNNASGTSGNMPKINQQVVINTLIPITNSDEQKAIVEKINGLMSLCDQLEQEIENHQTSQEQWMQSCLRGVV